MAAGTIPGPPFSVELLADLHAGNMPPSQAAQLWPEVRRDADAMRYLDSLDGINGRLRDLGGSEHIAHAMPDDVFARLEGFLDALVSSEHDDATDRVGPAPTRALNGIDPTEVTRPARHSGPGVPPRPVAPRPDAVETTHRVAPIDPTEVTRPVSPADVERTDRVDPQAHARRMATVHQLRNRDAHPGPAQTAPMPALTPSIFDTGRLDPRDLADHEPEIDDNEPIPLRPAERMSTRMRWISAAAAAVAVLAGGVVAVDALRGGGTSPQGEPDTPILLDASLPSSVLRGAMGKHEVSGPLAQGDALTSCLKAADLNRTQLGARSVTYNGQEAVLVLLPAATPPGITAVVLGVNCAPGNPQVLATVDIQ
ncbi:hypothetical protein [Nocardia huaxiensis]|uniref:hypothetical protein n=1 Tax=Nocardia huaxiensis TaxID=2755382 RepID=UPI001E5708B6|nr:hypothetical protein [Nocardia huaxiensis]UFS94574.1 hypothetical protein LPY97_28050 [Nocardia huaxiensis]